MRVLQYMDCSWRNDDMSLLDFLRKTNKHGQVHRALKRRFAAFAQRQESDAEETTLEAWANKAPRRGDVANVEAAGYVALSRVESVRR